MEVISIRAVSTSYKTVVNRMEDKGISLSPQSTTVDGKDVAPSDFLMSLRARMAGDITDTNFYERIFPPVLPEGFEFFYRWNSRQELEYGVRERSASGQAPAVEKKTSEVSQMSMAKLLERAAELSIPSKVDGKSKSREQLIAEVAAKEAGR